MRKLIAALFLSALVGCALFSKAPLSAKPLVACASPQETVTAACNAAVDAIEKANVLAASVNTAIDDAFVAKTISKAQATSYRARTKQVDTALDTAQASLDSLNFSTAFTQANATKLLLEALNKEIAAEVAKGNQ